MGKRENLKNNVFYQCNITLIIVYDLRNTRKSRQGELGIYQRCHWPVEEWIILQANKNSIQKDEHIENSH